LVAGVLSDVYRPWAGNESLRYALLTLWPGFLGAGWYLWRASKTVTADLQVAQFDCDGQEQVSEKISGSEQPLPLS
jgi:hypothetical protein